MPPAEPATRGILAEALRSGTAGGVAMIPLAAIFRAEGLRVNEYGRRTLALLVGDVGGRSHDVLTLVQHLIISWLAALPLVLILPRLSGRGARAWAGVAYGGLFYLAINSLALPLAFGDPTPWAMGWSVVYPSLSIHLVYGLVAALTVRARV